MIVMGAGTNHWFHSDQTYRAMLSLVIFCGCQGVNGGGWAHYVGQEKVRPLTGWQTVAFALDWNRPPRQQPATPFWYLATDQWRYETFGAGEFSSPAGPGALGDRHIGRLPRAGGPPGLAALRADLRPQPARPRRRGPRGRPRAGRARGLRAARRAARLRLRGPRRPGQLPPRAHPLAGEPARLLEQGPRVLPAPPARRPRRRRALGRVRARGSPRGGALARGARPRASSTSSPRSTSA